ncbi:MAG: hypothetical protein EG825_15650, partial [Rhodocyclaceae bacterium]|nr:hypothetical protein [Rhodocyclaceae bacterium]
MILRASHDNGATWSAPAPFAASKEITLPAGDGSSTVQVKFIDHAGNVSLPASDTINLDTTKPAGTLQINGGADYTNKTAVTLGMTAADGATGSGISQARYSLNGTTWSAWEAYKPTRAFTLPAGAGSKTVYAQLKDKAGNASEPVMDSITLDISRPSDGSCTATPNGDNTLLLA